MSTTDIKDVIKFVKKRVRSCVRKRQNKGIDGIGLWKRVSRFGFSLVATYAIKRTVKRLLKTRLSTRLVERARRERD